MTNDIERVCRSCDMKVQFCICEMPDQLDRYINGPREPGGTFMPLVVDPWEVNALEGLVEMRLISAEGHAEGRDGEPPEYVQSEAADIKPLRRLLSRIRFAKRELERLEAQS